MEKPWRVISNADGVDEAYASLPEALQEAGKVLALWRDHTGGMAYIADYINKHLDALAPIDYNENAELRARNDELLTERLQLNARIQVAYDALDQLARLGNGDRLGNSDGNVIAQEAIARLDKMAEPLICTCNEPDSLCQLHTF